MRTAGLIESLKQAGPLNIVWGAGCSYSHPNAAKTLLFELKINCKLQVAGPKGIHAALMSLDREKRREKANSYGVNWAHICLAELLRAGRVARLLTANFDQGIVKATAALRLLPELYRDRFPELAESAIPGIYSLGEAEPAAVAGLIERGAQTGPWLVIGCSGEHFGLPDAMLAVPRFEHGLWWVGYFDQPPPASLGREFFAGPRRAHFIGGFDADSFMAYLVRGLGEFPPSIVLGEGEPAAGCCGSENSVTPASQLHRWRHRLSERMYRIRDSHPQIFRDLLKKAATARGEEYSRMVSDAMREQELYFRWSPEGGRTACIFLRSLAEKRSPSEAMRLLHKGLEWTTRFPCPPAMAAMEAGTIAEACSHLARFRTGAEADALFARGEKALASATPGSLAPFLAEAWAEHLCRWAGQERNAASDAIFDRARQKFREGSDLEPEKLPRRLRYAEALRLESILASNDRGLELLAEARSQVDPLLRKNPEDAATAQFLGLVSIVEAQKNPPRKAELLAEAARYFGDAVASRPDAAGDILMGWAAALGVFAMARSGEEALELYALAGEKCRESEKVKPDSRALRKNWSSFLLREARERGGSQALYAQAQQQAEMAETIDPGSGAYNLACIAAELRDSDGVARWLRRSAEYGHIMPLSHILRDVNFETIRSEPWFRNLLEEIFHTAPPQAAG